MKGLVKVAVLTVTLGIGGAFYSSGASAHGYIKEPVSRAYMGALEKQTLGWTAAAQKYGSVIDNPQSVEGPKGFPVAGPPDGRIASANGDQDKLTSV